MISFLNKGKSFSQGLPFDFIDICNEQELISGCVIGKWKGEELIHWFHERCGKSEEAHAVMKDDLAGGKLPSDDFGENAAWWWIMILAFNLNAIMKKLVLGESRASNRMKAGMYLSISPTLAGSDSKLLLKVTGWPLMWNRVTGDQRHRTLLRFDGLVKSQNRRQSKKLQIQGAQILRNDEYLEYAAMTKDAAQRRSRTFYEVVKV